MKAICAYVNFDRFMVLPRPTARISRAAKLEFSSNLRSRKPEAGQQVHLERSGAACRDDGRFGERTVLKDKMLDRLALPSRQA